MYKHDNVCHVNELVKVVTVLIALTTFYLISYIATNHLVADTLSRGLLMFTVVCLLVLDLYSLSLSLSLLPLPLHLLLLSLSLSLSFLSPFIFFFSLSLSLSFSLSLPPPPSSFFSFLSLSGGVDFSSAKVSGQFDAMSNDLDHCYNVPVFVDDLVEGEEVFTVSVNLKTSLSPSLSQKLVIDQTRVKITIVDTSKCHTQLTSTCMYHWFCTA